MDRWLNVWCIWHTYLETLQECGSRRRIGWIIQDFWETCVSRSLTFRLETKIQWCQTPSRKKKAAVFTNVTTKAYQDQLHAGFSKACEIFKVHGIESLKYVQEFHTLLLWRHFHAPKRDANEWNELWLVVWHVGQTASWAGLGQWKLPYIPDLQLSVWRSGYTRQGKPWHNVMFNAFHVVDKEFNIFNMAQNNLIQIYVTNKLGQN